VILNPDGSGQALFQDLVKLLNVDLGMQLVTACEHCQIPDQGPGWHSRCFSRLWAIQSNHL